MWWANKPKGLILNSQIFNQTLLKDSTIRKAKTYLSNKINGRVYQKWKFFATQILHIPCEKMLKACSLITNKCKGWSMNVYP